MYGGDGVVDDFYVDVSGYVCVCEKGRESGWEGVGMYGRSGGFFVDHVPWIQYVLHLFYSRVPNC